MKIGYFNFIILLTLFYPALGMHNSRNVPTIGHNQVAPAPSYAEPFDQRSGLKAAGRPELDAKKLAEHQARERQFAWPTAADSAETESTQVDTQKEQKLNVDYSQLADDDIFAVTGLPKEIQQIIKDYNRPPISLMPAFMSRKIIDQTFSNCLMLPDNHFATIENNIVAIYNMGTGERNEYEHPTQVHQIVSIPGDTATDNLLIGITDEHLYTWVYQRNELVYRKHMPYEHIIKFKHNLIIAQNNTLILWDVRKNKTIKSVDISADTRDIVAHLHALEDGILIETKKDTFMLWLPENGLRTLEGLRTLNFSHIRGKITCIQEGLIVEKPHTQIAPRWLLPNKRKRGRLVQFYDLKQDKFLQHATTFIEEECYISRWDTSTQQFEIFKPDASLGEISKIDGIGGPYSLIYCDESFKNPQRMTSYRSIYLYDSTQKKYSRMLQDSKIYTFSINDNGSAILISFKNYTPGMVEHEGPARLFSYDYLKGTVLITENAAALQAVQALSVDAQHALEKLIALLDKNYGIKGIFETTPFSLPDNIRQQFMALPEPIRRCLKQWYDITEKASESESACCIIS